MIQLDTWVNSGMYIFVILSEEGYQANEIAKTTWPSASIYGDYRLVNFHKDNVEEFIAQLDSLGYTPTYGLGGNTPMLVTWEEAKEFTAQYNIE